MKIAVFKSLVLLALLIVGSLVMAGCRPGAEENLSFLPQTAAEMSNVQSVDSAIEGQEEPVFIGQDLTNPPSLVIGSGEEIISETSLSSENESPNINTTTNTNEEKGNPFDFASESISRLHLKKGLIQNTSENIMGQDLIAASNIVDPALQQDEDVQDNLEDDFDDDDNDYPDQCDDDDLDDEDDDDGDIDIDCEDEDVDDDSNDDHSDDGDHNSSEDHDDDEDDHDTDDEHGGDDHFEDHHDDDEYDD